MNELKELDQIAYVRFASVYRQFADIDSLRGMLDELERTARRAIRSREQLSLMPEEDMDRQTRVVPLQPRVRRRQALLREVQGARFERYGRPPDFASLGSMPSSNSKPKLTPCSEGTPDTVIESAPRCPAD